MTVDRETHSERHRLVGGTFRIGIMSLINVAAAFLRYKVIAVLLGAAGLGAYGIMLNSIATVTALAGLGLAFSLTGGLGKASGDDLRQTELIAHSLIVTTVSGVLAIILMLMLSQTVWPNVLPSGERALMFCWLLPGILCMLWYSLLGAALMGLGETAKFTRASVLTTMIATPVGIALIWSQGMASLIPVIFLNYIVGTAVILRALGRARLIAMRRFLDVQAAWRTTCTLLPVGLHFMAGTALATGSFVLAQGLVAAAYGLETAGGLQAVYAISLQLSAFLLLSMQANLYPQLSAVGQNLTEARRISNNHAQFLLILAGALFLGVNCFAEIIFLILFGAEFSNMVTFAAIWFLGDAVKVLAWILGLNLIVQDQNRRYVAGQATAAATFIVIVGLAVYFNCSIEVVAFANLAGAVAMLAAAHLASPDRAMAYWRRDVLLVALQLMICLGLIVLLRLQNSPFATPIGAAAFFGFTAFYARPLLARLRRRAGLVQ